MQTYWDAYLDEMGAKLHDKKLRQILEDFWRWHQRQVSKQCESPKCKTCGDKGWVYHATTRMGQEPQEEPEKVDCPSCTANADLGVLSALRQLSETPQSTDAQAKATTQLWCAWCGKWGDHQSGSCVNLREKRGDRPAQGDKALPLK
jgi:hypothetical protein